VRLSDPRRVRLLQFDTRTGRVVASVAVGNAGGRPVAEGLYDAGTRNPELLVATRGSTVRWRRPLASIFALGDPSTDWGWNFGRIDALNLFVGSPGWGPLERTKRRVVWDLAREMTAGFRISDGSVVWRVSGARYMCEILPCRGGSLSSYASLDSGASSVTVGVRIRSRGTLTITRGGQPQLSPDTRVAIEGFDLASGRTRWSFDLGRNSDVIMRTQLALAARNSIVVRDARRRLVALDLGDGSTVPMSAAAGAWCRKKIVYANRYAGQDAAFPCTAANRKRSEPRSVPAFIAEIGARVGGLAVWTDTKGLRAAPVGG
jgi:hypothetical protein